MATPNKRELCMLMHTRIFLCAVGGDSYMSGQSVTSTGPEIFPLWQMTVPATPALCDFTPKSLIPIWELVADRTRAAQIKGAFEGKPPVLPPSVPK